MPLRSALAQQGTGARATKQRSFMQEGSLELISKCGAASLNKDLPWGCAGISRFDVALQLHILQRVVHQVGGASAFENLVPEEHGIDNVLLSCLRVEGVITPEGSHFNPSHVDVSLHVQRLQEVAALFSNDMKVETALARAVDAVRRVVGKPPRPLPMAFVVETLFGKNFYFHGLQIMSIAELSPGMATLHLYSGPGTSSTPAMITTMAHEQMPIVGLRVYIEGEEQQCVTPPLVHHPHVLFCSCEGCSCSVCAT